MYINDQVNEKFFQENTWLRDAIAPLTHDLKELGIEFFNWYSTCCSTCGVNQAFRDSPCAVAYKLFVGGGNSNLAEELEWDDDAQDYINLEQNYFAPLKKVVVAYNYEDIHIARQVKEILEEYFNVEWDGTLDKFYTITPKREPTPCKVLDVE